MAPKRRKASGPSGLAARSRVQQSRESDQDALVGCRQLKERDLLERRPPMIDDSQMLDGQWTRDLGRKGVEPNDPVTVVVLMDHEGREAGRINLDADFLAKLARRRARGRFPGFDLAPWKLPEPR